MRKFYLVMAVILISAGLLVGCKQEAKAETLNIPDIIQKIPTLKQGIGYSFLNHEVNYLSTFDVAKWKEITLEVGYNSKDKVIAIISYPLLNLKKDFNVTMPILDLITCRLGVYGGYGRLGVTEGNNEFDWGMSATLLEIKF